jgi:hypothetical protein
MTAPASFPPLPFDAATACGCPAECFVGQFLGKVAEFEIWMVERLARLDPKPRIETLIGSRVAALRKAIEQKPAIVRRPKRVAELLDRLQPLLDLRSTIAHARTTALQSEEGERMYLFETASPDADRAWQARTLLRDRELKALQGNLAKLVKELRDQTPDA